MQFHNNTHTAVPTFAQSFARNGWQKTCLIALVAIACMALFASTAKAFQADKPNIVLINLDDADTEILSTENMEAHYPTLAVYQRSFDHTVLRT